MKYIGLVGGCVCAAAMSAVLSGCAFSASASMGTRVKIEGKEKITITAAKPEEERKAKVVGKKIEITEKVMFDTAKATIKPASHDLLSDVAAVMREHAEIQKVRIEGHTDADGAEKYNKKLSQNRADAVKAFLVDAGIDAARMEAVGYGESRPIADNESETGKEKNRRVEFNILAQKAGEE